MKGPIKKCEREKRNFFEGSPFKMHRIILSHFLLFDNYFLENKKVYQNFSHPAGISYKINNINKKILLLNFWGKTEICWNEAIIGSSKLG
jgi:hypothetical protein